MKMFLTLFLMISAPAMALEPRQLKGLDQDGAPCSLQVEDGDLAAAVPWMRVRTSWQPQDRPALLVRRSHTPDALYGKSADEREQVALILRSPATGGEPVRAFLYESKLGSSLLQTYCNLGKSPR